MAAWNKVVPYTWNLVPNTYRCTSGLLRSKEITHLAQGFSHSIQENMVEQPVKKKRQRKRVPKVEIREFLNSSEGIRGVVNDIPNKFINTNRCPPEALYVVDPSVAVSLVDKIKDYMPSENENVPVMEISPGLGLVSQELLNVGVKHLRLFEPSASFHNRLYTFIKNNPEKKVELRTEDLVNLTKLTFQDKLDNGTRMAEIMTGIKPKAWSDPSPVVKVVGCTPNRKVLKDMVFSIAFQNGFAAYGRPEYFIIMHPYNYIQLTCGRDEGYLVYRYNSALFQIMYKSTLIAKLPRKAFLPWESDYIAQKHHRLAKLQAVDNDSLYLVRAEARRELLDQVRQDQLQQLWYFVRIHLLSRKKRIIPALERWIPGCGPRLIRQGLTIFTEFGDLNPPQILRLFQLFSSWPEFPQCPFQASMETAFLKNDPADIDKEEEEENSSLPDTETDPPVAQ